MRVTLSCLGVGVVLLSLTPPTLAFSRGASKSSCQEMIPGHIRAQPQDPEHSHVTLRTSTSSYRPGQLVTVTVRSSRDFMGFLLQARSVEGTRTKAGVGAKAGVRPTSLGPVLVGGSWVLAPPGTHTIRCFTQGDTLTHSDKQLKRNLSFVWKAPDVPMGDVKFYVTVVQSYFVHWAGIESTVVHDGSRSPWSGSNNTEMDRGNSDFALEDQVTDLQAVQAYQASNNQKTEATSPATTLGPPTTTSTGRPNDITQETLTEGTHPVLEMKSPADFASLRVNHLRNLVVNQPKNETITERNSALILDGEIDANTPSRSLSGVTASSVTTLEPFTSTTSGTQGEQLKEVTHPALDGETSATLAHLEVENITNQEGDGRKSNQILDYLQNLSEGTDAGTYATSGFFSGEEASTDKGSPVDTSGPSATTKLAGPVLVLNYSATLGTLGVAHLTNKAVTERTAPVDSGSLPNFGSEAEPYSTSGSLSSVTEEASTETGSTVARTKTEDLENSPVSSDPLPFIASLSSVEGSGMEGPSTLMPQITKQNPTSPFPNTSLALLREGDVERNETNDTTSNPTIGTSVIPSTNHRLHVTNSPRSTFQYQGGATKDQTSSVQFQTQSSSSQHWRGTQTESQMSHGWGSQSTPQPQSPHIKHLLHSQTSSPKPFHQVQMSTSKPRLGSQSGTSQTFPKTQTSLPNLVPPSESPTLQSIIQSHTTTSFPKSQTKSLKLPPEKPLSVLEHQTISNLPKTPPDNGPSGLKTRPPLPRLAPTAPLSITPEPKHLTSSPQALPQTIPTHTKGQADFLQHDPDPTPKVLSISPTSWFQPHSLTGAPKVYSHGWTKTQSTTTPGSFNPQTFKSRIYPTSLIGRGKEVKDLLSEAKIRTMSPIFASITPASPSPNTPLPSSHSSSPSSTHSLICSALAHPSSTTPLHPNDGSTQVSTQGFSTRSSPPNPSATKNQPKTTPAFSPLPSSSPIPTPPNLPSVQPSSPSYELKTLTSSTTPSSNSSHYASTSAPVTTSTISPLTSTTSLIFSASSSSNISPDQTSSSATDSLSSSISSSSPPHTTSSTSLDSSQSTTPHPGPSPAPHHSPFNTVESTSSRQQLTLGQKLLLQNDIASSDPESNHNQPSPRTVVHPNPEPHPNLDPNIKANFGHKLIPNIPKSNPKTKHPSNPSLTPGKEGKYPDIIPRHSSWELGMLLGCSAGLGMVLVVGVRYMYRQACGKRTEVTLNDREREYGRGERGMIHVQECGDLVRVRRIRDNSFVLLAEYDILASPGD